MVLDTEHHQDGLLEPYTPRARDAHALSNTCPSPSMQLEAVQLGPEESVTACLLLSITPRWHQWQAAPLSPEGGKGVRSLSCGQCAEASSQCTAQQGQRGKRGPSPCPLPRPWRGLAGRMLLKSQFPASLRLQQLLTTGLTQKGHPDLTVLFPPGSG